jgi:ATP-dependent HslUV protease ATP-binding subunit HslU
MKLSQPFGNLMGKKTEIRKLTVAEARPLLEEMEMDSFLSPEDLSRSAVKAVQEDGIVFLDEIDKICSTRDSHIHADASAEGVQRDLLPLLEGTTITTKQGDIQTDHILFICSGAFHSVKPSDLMAELQVTNIQNTNNQQHLKYALIRCI